MLKNIICLTQLLHKKFTLNEPNKIKASSIIRITLQNYLSYKINDVVKNII
jgi:hypothetical protein